MKVTYPAVFHEDERGGYFIDFPDVENAFTEGETIQESLEMAQEVLGSILAISYIEKGAELPEITPIKQIETDEKSFTTLITAEPLRYVKDSKTVRKNVTIPEWLVKKAEKAQINFSETLTEALFKKLEG